MVKFGFIGVGYLIFGTFFIPLSEQTNKTLRKRSARQNMENFEIHGLGNSSTSSSALDKDDMENVAHNNHPIEYKTPKKSTFLLDGERLLDKINILTTKPENTSTSTKVIKWENFEVLIILGSRRKKVKTTKPLYSRPR